jgi:hypothetical protein
MKKLTYTIAIFVAMAATSVFAHHPSEEMNPNFDVVDEQIADTPHDEMLPYDVGSTSAAGDSAMATAAQDQSGWAAVTGEGQTQDGTMTLEQPQDGSGPAAGAGTMVLMEDITP